MARKLVFIYRIGSGSFDIGRVVADGSQKWQPVLNTEASESDAALSPDGRRIAYAAIGRSDSVRACSSQRVLVARITTGVWCRVTDQATSQRLHARAAEGCERRTISGRGARSPAGRPADETSRTVTAVIAGSEGQNPAYVGNEKGRLKPAPTFDRDLAQPA